MRYIIKEFHELSNQELYDILRVRSEVFVLGQKCIYQDCDGKDQRSHHMFSKTDGEIDAYVRIVAKGISYDEVSIGRVLVPEKFRGHGRAEAIMRAAIEFIRTNLGEREIRISAQKYLVEFYSKLGFRICSEVYFEDQIEHIEMIYEDVDK